MLLYTLLLRENHRLLNCCVVIIFSLQILMYFLVVIKEKLQRTGVINIEDTLSYIISTINAEEGWCKRCGKRRGERKALKAVIKSSSTGDVWDLMENPCLQLLYSETKHKCPPPPTYATSTFPHRHRAVPCPLLNQH